MQALGQKVTHHKLNDEEFLHELKRKLFEETNEFDPKDPKTLQELADLLEVIEAAGQQHGQDFESLRKLQLERREERGSFGNRIYIERLDLADDDPWVKYYAAEPGRFPESKVHGG